MVREGRIFTSTAGSGRPAFGSGLMVNVLAPGAQVTQGSVSTTITVAEGHGFAAGDKYMVGTDLNTYSGALSVLSVTATTLELAAIRPVASGDLIVNLGPDSGVPAPMYDGNSVTVYIDPDYANAFVNGLVWSDANGRYRYHHKSIQRWEIVRSALAPIAIYQDDVSSGGDIVSVMDFGAIGDGSHDDTSAIQAGLDSFSSSGGTLYFPPGEFIIGTTLYAGNGINLLGAGALASTITASSAFSGTEMILFQKQPASKFANDGIGMRHIRVDVNHVDTTAVRVYKAYDAVTFDTVLVDHVGLTGRAFSFEPDPNDTGDGVSQTLLMSNCFGIHGPLGSTGAVFYFKHMQEMTLVNCKGFGGLSTATGNCDVFHFDGCRGVSMFGGAAAITQGNGIRIRCSERESQGLAFYGLTFEAVGKAMLAGGDVLAASYIVIDGSRYQLGVVTPPVVTGGFDFQNVTMGTVRTSPGFTLSVDALCNRTNFYTVQLSHLISDLGAGTKVYADYDATVGIRHSIMRQPLAIVTDDASGPEVYFGNTESVDYWRLFWSKASAGADFGFQLRYVNTSGVSKRITTVEAGAGTQRFYVTDSEVLSLASVASGESAMYLLVNDGAVTSLRRVTVGAADSGGSGYRLLRVAN